MNQTLKDAERLADIARDLTRSELERLLAVSNLLQIVKKAVAK